MFNFFKPKPAKHLYKISYCLNALIDVSTNIVTFNLNFMNEKIVAAEDAMHVQVEFAKNNAIYPHVYIHKVEKA